MPNQTVFGFDFGVKKIGIAVGQTVTRTASPLAIVKTKNGEPPWDEIQKLIQQWKPMALIVGRPLNMDGTIQPLTEMASNFANELKSRYGLSVHEVDERLSTVEARASVFEEGGYRALKKSSVDSVAAKIILEDWLNKA